MKSFAAIAVLAAVAVAQTLPPVPPCALNCFVTALSGDGCSSLTDFKCHCSKPELISTVQPCVEKACSAAEVTTVIGQVSDICKQAGVPINLPPAGGASSSKAPAPSSSAAGSPSSSKAPAASSAYGGASSAAPSGYTTSTVAAPTNGTSYPSPSQYTGAAPQVTQFGAILAGLAVAVAAF